MSVKSFECAIARSQIGRYLAGDTLGEEAMRQLEGHIGSCADCQRLIDSKRTALLGPLAGAPTAEEAIASSPESDVRAMERELRVAATKAQAVVQVHAAVAEPALVGAGAPGREAFDPWNAAPTNAAPGASASNFPPSGPNAAPSSESFSAEAPAGLSISTARPAMPKPSLSGLGAAFSRLPLPKLVRDVPEETSGEPKRPVATEPKAKPANRPLGKAAAYGGALVIVLGAMAYLGDPISLLGGKAAGAEPGPKMKAGSTVAKASGKPEMRVGKNAVVRATGVRRSALGVPITDAADSSTPPQSEVHSKPVAPAVAKPAPHAATPTGDPSDLGPLEFDPQIDAPAPIHTPAAHARPATHKPIATEPVKRAAARPHSVARPHSARPTVTPVAQSPTTAKPIRKRAAKPTVRRVKRTRKPTVRPVAKSQPVIRVYDETGKPIN